MAIVPLFRSRERAREMTSAAITAATTQIAGPNDEDRELTAQQKSEAWQARAWQLYDEVGEVGFAARYMGDAQARLDLFVGTRPSPDHDPVPLEDEEGNDELGYTAAEKEACDDALDRLKSPIGG